MDSTLVDPLPATEPAGLSELVRQLGREVLQLRQELNDLRHENAELRQQVGYWKAMHARADTARLQPPACRRGIPRIARTAARLPAVRHGADAQRHRGFPTDRDRGP